MKWDHLNSVLEHYAEALKNELQQNLLNDGSNASGTLVNSLRYILYVGDTEMSVSIGLEEYWKFIEYDTKPHWPPIDAIRKWIEVKPVIPQVRDGRLPTVDQLAFLISRKISRDGTQGTQFFHRAQQTVNERFLLSIEKAVEEDLNEELDIILEPLKRL